MNTVLTKDGSKTLYAPEFDEHYHSVFGAITESQHIFIEAGFKSLVQNGPITLFEIGFGTGLNALLTALQTGFPVHYYTIDTTPLGPEIVNDLNYPLLLDYPGASSIFNALHNAAWNCDCKISASFTLHKIHQSLVDYIPDFRVDLVYFDAFAPDKQPEMWSREIFSRLYSCMKPGGILTTYCVKGDIKRNLKQAGFMIEKLPGPPGKREILRGRKVE